ncbi:DUF2622 domain-containing protein [Pseudomonas syringae group genomosp. 3]|uniref:DUF2622 domain-containing protein n=1 Tax=Pseudomonas syringae group genomosp. 3 TaxID=251701 RepID=UPI000C070B73|nr:DUF2622 domain-containing protein [Pseudomonas syringae group genomosp. 3]
MAEYLVRVEIFKANAEEYTGLHDGMEALGLKRTIKGDKTTSKLPPGTYYGTSNLETEALREPVRSLATPFSQPRDPAIIVSQSATWSGWLEPA